MALGSIFGGTVGKAVVELVGDNSKLVKDFEAAKVQTAAQTEQMAATGTANANKLSTGVVVAAAVAGAALVKFGITAVHSYQAAQLSTEKLNNTLEHNLKLSDVSRESWDDQAVALRNLTGTSASATRSSQALLGQFDLTGKQVQELIPLVIDLSAKMGIDQVAAAKAVGKATAGSGAILGRYGIVLDKARLETDAYGTVIDGLSQKVGGFAEEEAKTLEGQLRVIGAQFGAMSSTAGHFIVVVLTPLVTGFAMLLKGVNALPGPLKDTIVITALLATTFLVAKAAVSLMTFGLAKMGITFGATAAAEGAAVVGMTAFEVVAAQAAVVLGTVLDTIMTSMPWLFALAAAFLLVKKGVDLYNQSQDDAASHTENMTTEVDGLWLQVAKGNVTMEEAERRLDQLTTALEHTGGREKDIALVTERSAKMRRILNDAIAAGVDPVDALRQASGGLNRELVDQVTHYNEILNLQLQLEGGFVGITAAADALKDKQKALNDVEAKLVNLREKGKTGTKAYAEAQRDQRAAALDVLNAGMALQKQVSDYGKQLVDSGKTQKQVIAAVREQGEQYGLTKGEIDKIIDSTKNYISTTKGVSHRVVTEFRAEGLTEAQRQAKLLKYYLDTLPKHITTFYDFQKGSTGGQAVASGGVVRAASGVVTRPTLLVGEGARRSFAGRGAEAVIPFDDRGIGILAEALSRAGDRSGGASPGGSGPGVPIILELRIGDRKVARHLTLAQGRNKALLEA